MKKIVLVLAAQLLFVWVAQAQFDLPESKYLSQLRSKTLLVPEQEEATSTLKLLQNKPEELQAYKDGVARFNEMLHRTIDKYWQIGKGVEYMPKSKADKEMADGNSKMVELVYELREGDVMPIMFSKIYGQADYSNGIRLMSKAAGNGVFRLKLAGAKGKPSETIYSVFLPVAYPAEGDMVYAIRMMNNELAKAMKDRSYQVNEFEGAVVTNNKQLKAKTLLIDPSQIDSKTTVEELRKNYSGSVQLVDYEKISEAILNADSTYAYVMIVPGGDPGTKVNALRTPVMHLVVDAASNNVLGAVKPNRMEYGKIQTDISRKEIKDYLNK
jgi:hypothetical protein